MRAILVEAYGDADALQPKEIDTPEPGPGEALVRVTASGVTRLTPR